MIKSENKMNFVQNTLLTLDQWKRYSNFVSAHLLYIFRLTVQTMVGRLTVVQYILINAFSSKQKSNASLIIFFLFKKMKEFSLILSLKLKFSGRKLT